MKFNPKKVTLEFGDLNKLAAWEAHMKSLKAQLAQAKRHHDYDRAAQLEAEIKAYMQNSRKEM
jgi:hypothetical protein